MPESRKKGETDEQFISRCMSETKSEYPDEKQRYAVCKSYSEKMSKENKQEELFVLQPRKTENRGTYLTRCSKHPKVRTQFKGLKERMGFCLNCFNEYYRYWSKLEDFAEVPADTALGECIAREKAKGFDYKEAYAHCSTKIGTPPLGAGGSIVLSEDEANLLIEPVMFGNDVSIDFDDTLSTKDGQDMAKRLIDEGVNLFIITRRQKDDSDEVYKIADEIGIPKENIYFTNGKLKWETIKKLGITKHIDNNSDELDAITENLPNVKVVKFQDDGQGEMDIHGYQTKYFYVCPGAQATFQHLIEMDVDDDTKRMIRNAAVLADNLFEIEAKVMEKGVATDEDLTRAEVIVKDFYGLMDVIDRQSGMTHDVAYMDGHIEKIKTYLK